MRFRVRLNIRLRFYITVQVMTVADVSSGHQNAIGTLLKCLENKVRVNPA